MNRLHYQQGDVIFEPTNGIPKGSTKVPSKPGEAGIVVAEGEATGHRHLCVGEAALLERKDERFLQVESMSVVTHEEHGKVTLPPGSYKIRIVKEFDPFDKAIHDVTD